MLVSHGTGLAVMGASGSGTVARFDSLAASQVVLLGSFR
jgi:hypothetical protein